MKRRDLLLSTGASLGAVGVLLLGGCASINQLATEVSTFGDWPAGRSGGSYVFERLPSQQAQADDSQLLEDAAAPALARAGFTPAAAGAEPDVRVQVAVRVNRSDRSPWDDPLWWGGGFGGWRHGPWRGPYWGGSLHYESPRYDREVALLIRDRSSNKPLFEARASNEGFQRQSAGLLAPMFAAALVDFPRTGINPRRVVVPLTE